MLACWKPTQLPLPDGTEDGLDPEMLEACDLVPHVGEDHDFAHKPLAVAWDKREDFEPQRTTDGRDLNDLGWIGEGPDGVWMQIHPVAALTTEPLLWDIWTAWRFGQRTIDRQAFQELSNFELEAFSALIQADHRQQRRAMKGDDEDGDA